MSHVGCVALPRGAMGLSAVCGTGISWSYSLFFMLAATKFGVKIIHMYGAHTKFCGTLFEMNETMTPVHKDLNQSLNFVCFDSLCPSQQFFSHVGRLLLC